MARPKGASTIHHAQIPASRAEEFFERIDTLSKEFTKLPREGDTIFGFVAAVYPTARPTLPHVEARP